MIPQPRQRRRTLLYEAPETTAPEVWLATTKDGAITYGLSTTAHTLAAARLLAVEQFRLLRRGIAKMLEDEAATKLVRELRQATTCPPASPTPPAHPSGWDDVVSTTNSGG